MSLSWVIYILHFHKCFSTSFDHVKVKPFLGLALYFWLGLTFTEVQLVGSVTRLFWIIIPSSILPWETCAGLKSVRRTLSILSSGHRSRAKLAWRWRHQPESCFSSCLFSEQQIILSLYWCPPWSCSLSPPHKTRIVWHSWIYPPPSNTLDVFSTSSPVLLGLLFVGMEWKCCSSHWAVVLTQTQLLSQLFWDVYSTSIHRWISEILKWLFKLCPPPPAHLSPTTPLEVM